MKKALFYITIVLCTVLAHGQVANNTVLVGTITDSSGSVVADAPVSAVNVDTKVVYTGKTNSDGYYSIPYITPGTYDITVEQEGFQKVTSKGVVVQLNLAARTDFQLVVGSANAEITVTAATPVLSTDDSVIGETVDEHRVANLPMAGRRAMDLAATAPNIIVGPKTSFTGNPPGANYIGAGTREVTNSLTLDGITIMNSLISSSSVTPNPDAISAVQTQTGNYTAQYGAYMGVHINMDTKRGSNNFHGTAYDYVQNDMFNARPWLLSKTSKMPTLRYNQFGGVIGGPIIFPHFYNGRDKAFFMGSYEGVRQISAAQSTATVLTPSMRSGDFSAISKSLINPATGVAYTNNQITNISPIAQKLLSYMPLPNLAGTVSNLNSTVPNNYNQDQTLDRVDYNLNDSVRLFGRYSWQKLTFVSGSLAPTANSYSPTTNSNGAFGYTHIITPTFINDFRFGYNKLTTQVLNYFAQNNIAGAGSALGIPGFTADVDSHNPGLPSIAITNFLSLGADGTNWYQDDRTLHGYDQITWNHGKHSVMAGLELRKMSIGRAAQNAPRGSFTFSGQYSGNAASDFLTGYASTVVTPVTQIKGSITSWRDGFFVQDNWQIRQNLTLLYGLRYELPTVPYSLNGYARVINTSYTALIPDTTATTGAAFTPKPGFEFIAPNHALWAPRFGLAYRANSKVVVRAGGGIYYNPNHMNAFTLATGNYPLANSFTYNGNTASPANLSFTNPTGGQSGSSSCVPGTIGCYASVFNVNHELPTPRLYQWNVDTGMELWKNAAFELQYLGSRAVHLDYSYYPNQPTPGAGSVNPRRPNQRFGQIRQIQNSGFSTYHGMNAIFRQRLTHGLDLNLGYTWAHSMDTSNDANGGGTSMIQYNLKADYGNSNWDIRHRFVGTIIYSLPELRRYHPAVRAALGGWQANTIITIQSGMPFNVGMSSDIANAGNVGTQRPNWATAGSSSCSRNSVIKNPGKTCIDPSAYRIPTTYTYGNLRRNDLHGPGFVNTNLSIFKNFPLVEGVSLQFRAEAFNVFNHANPANPNATLPASFNPSASDYGLTGSNFGTITSVQNSGQNGGGQRLLQLAGKINF